MEDLFLAYEEHIVQERPWLNILIVASVIFLIVILYKKIKKIILKRGNRKYIEQYMAKLEAESEYRNSPEYKKELERRQRESKKELEAKWARQDSNARRCKSCFHYRNNSCSLSYSERMERNTCSQYTKGEFL